MSLPNPFPAFPVARLVIEESSEELQEPTIETEAIKESRERLRPYISQWLNKASGRNPELKVPSMMVAVKGDFGSGKTRLLLDALAQIEQKLSDDYPYITILRFPCIETTPENWYRSTIGPLLKPQSGDLGFLQDAIVHLYANAGEQVAEGVELTLPAVTKLQKDPYSIHELIRENMLNRTACDRVFKDLLRTACHKGSDEVQRALGGLVWGETSSAAIRWLAGEELTYEEADLLQVKSSASTKNDVRDILVALAGIHSYLDRPFGLMIDELEHLTRYDEIHNSKNNLTWLKRLLEELAKDQIVVYVAGHLAAWKVRLREGGGDLMGRFSQLTPITLDKLSPEDVLNLARAYVKDLSSERFGLEQAETILESTNSNMRRILTLCRVLFQESNGFHNTISKRQIVELAADIKQRISLPDARLYVRELFEEQGLEVRSNDAPGTKNILFDLVAYRNQPLIVVDFRHAFEQTDPVRDAQLFLIRVRHLYEEVPGIVGCFVSDGHVDEEAIDLFRSEPELVIYWFDLNEPEFKSRFSHHLTEMLEKLESASSKQLSASFKDALDRKAQIEEQEQIARARDDRGLVEQLQSEREELEKQVVELRQQFVTRTISLEEKLNMLEERRLQEYEEQRAWRESFARSMASQRDAEIITAPNLTEELRSTFHNTYAELTVPIGFLTKLRLALDRRTILTLLLAASGFLAFLAVSPLLVQLFALNSIVGVGASLILLDVAVGGLLLSFAVTIVWFRISAVDSYLDFSTHMLREVYIRSQEPQELLQADRILRESLEDKDPINARRVAQIRLEEAMPQYFGLDGYYHRPY